MHENYVCEVIGCGNQGCWYLVSRQDSSNEDLLCDTHWQLLHLRNPRRASRYMHLSSLLAEGMGLMAVVFTANLQGVHS